MKNYLANMKKTCAEFSMLGFSGRGFFFRTRFYPAVPTAAYSFATTTFRGIMFNARNVVDGVNGVDMDALYSDAGDTLMHCIVAGQPMWDMISSCVSAPGRWREIVEEPWERHVVNGEPIPDTGDARFFREYTYIDDCNGELRRIYSDYLNNPSIATNGSRAMRFAYGCQHRDFVAFQNWLKHRK